MRSVPILLAHMLVCHREPVSIALSECLPQRIWFSCLWFHVCFWKSCTRVRTISWCLLLRILYICPYSWFHVCFWESCTCVRTVGLTWYLLLGILYMFSNRRFDICFWESCTRVRTVGLMSAFVNPVPVFVPLVLCLLLGILYPCSYPLVWCRLLGILYMCSYRWFYIFLGILYPCSYRWVDDVCFWKSCTCVRTVGSVSAIYNPIFISLGWCLVLGVLSSYHWVYVCHL